MRVHQKIRQWRVFSRFSRAEDTLEDEREHGLPVRGVVLPKFLLVVLVLLDGPDRHLVRANDQEQPS